jgi:hypothetical protein
VCGEMANGMAEEEARRRGVVPDFVGYFRL